MRSTFLGIEIGKRGLLTQRAGTDITGQNVTNASTPGYSRQTPNVTSTSPLWMPGVSPAGVGGQLGTGAQVLEISRAEDTLLADQIRSNTSLQDRMQQFQATYTQLENIFVQPNESGLDTLLTNFFSSWQALSLAPDQEAQRGAVRDAGQTLVDEFHRITDHLSQYRSLLDQQAQNQVTKVNNLADQIAKANNEIARVVGTGQQPNDLLDQRDALLKELAAIVPIGVKEGQQRSAIVTIDGRVLVQDQEVRPLQTVVNWNNQSFVDVAWSDRTELSVKPDSGSLGATLYARDDLVPAFQQELDTLASTLVQQVNAVHTRTVAGVPTGYGLDGMTGRDFFQGNSAGTIDLTDQIKASTRAIQAGEQPVPGDGGNALAIAQLREALPLGGGTQTFASYFQGVTANLGSASDSLNGSLTTQGKLMTQLDNMMQQEVGVNLDEEFVNLIRYQQGYSAAARLVTAVDQSLDKLINGTGRVGL